jgi:hypothetical protein
VHLLTVQVSEVHDIMICDWMYHPNHDGHGIVQCRRCRQFASYRLTGYKPEPPEVECNPPEPKFLIAELTTGRVIVL